MKRVCNFKTATVSIPCPPLQLFGGFFIALDSLPVWVSWLKWLSIFRYGVEVRTYVCVYVCKYMYACTLTSVTKLRMYYMCVYETMVCMCVHTSFTAHGVQCLIFQGELYRHRSEYCSKDAIAHVSMRKVIVCVFVCRGSVLIVHYVRAATRGVVQILTCKSNKTAV